MPPGIWKGGNLSNSGRTTFLQAADNTTMWCLYYLESIFNAITIIVIKEKQSDFIQNSFFRMRH